MALRLTLAVLLLALFSGCASTHAVRLDTGEAALLEYQPPASNRSVEVGADAFEKSLFLLMLSAPLSMRSPEQGEFVRASYPSDDADLRWQRLLRKAHGGFCKPGQRTEHCLSLLDDVNGWSEREKFGIALGLSLDPLKESISRAVEKTLAPQLFYALVTTGIVTWAVLAANPEPVFTKAAAIVSALLLIYLGVEIFLDLVDACRELKRVTDKATTLEELEQASQRFANRVGPQVARVVVLAVTVAVCHGMTGGASWLASRIPMLPNYPEAAALVSSQLGINLGNVGQVSAVAVVGGTVVISLPAGAVAMAALGRGEDPTSDEPNGQLHHIISKRIFDVLKKHLTLKGRYTERDPRFVARAANKDAHNGYQGWHRDIEKEVIGWLRSHQDATPEQFEEFLREIYNRPEMRARFPNGF